MGSRDTVQTLESQSATSSSASEARHMQDSCSGLYPADGGTRAWAVLTATFFIEGVLWGKSLWECLEDGRLTRTLGLPLSFGVFERYYAQQSVFQDDHQIPVIGTLSTSTAYLGSPIMCVLMDLLPGHKVHMVWAGWLMCAIAVFSASFTSDVPTLIATQGFLYGMGCLALIIPLTALLYDWFVAKRGLAYAIVSSSTGITCSAFPFILQLMLDRFGAPTTLRGLAGFILIAVGPIILLIQPRSSNNHPSSYIFLVTRYMDVLRQPVFYFYSVSNFLQGIAYYLPSIFLPLYASTLGLDSLYGVLLIVIFSLAQLIGQLIFGHFADIRVSTNLLLIVSSGVSGLATFLLWGLSKSFLVLAIFSALFGFFASGWSVTWARMGMNVSMEPSAQIMTFGLFCAQRGVGNAISGPISGALQGQVVSLGSFGLGMFEGTIGLTGGCMFLSALTMSVWALLHSIPAGYFPQKLSRMNGYSRRRDFAMTAGGNGGFKAS